MNYLNTKSPFILFQEAVNDFIYVDKSLLIEDLTKLIRTKRKYICITKPRRFGKTTNANMLAAYYSKGINSNELFKGLAIEKKEGYREHLNQHNVISIDFSSLPGGCKSYDDYINFIWDNLYEDFADVYGIKKSKNKSPSYLLGQTGDSFIFILDEWDSIFYKDFITKKDKAAYLEFLKDLLKDKPYVELAYMTGVLPIAKYSSGSELNMFREYSFIDDPKFSQFFGFTEKEVMFLCKKFPSVSFEEMKEWYDGYYTDKGESLFNPRSVCAALDDGVCRNYWTQTGPMSEIADFIECNVEEVRDDVVKMVSGIPVEIKLQGYSALEPQMDTRDEILSAMVVFGFLAYWDNFLKIPNKELMLKFQAVLSRKSFGGVKKIVDRSKEMLEATLNKDTKKVSEILEYVHDMGIPILQYNNENSLSCVVTLCYLYARNYYKIEREMKTGKGFCDFIFYPLKRGYPRIILELKYNSSCSQALKKMKERNYVQKLKECGEVLLVGINYSGKKKSHQCKIEVVHHKQLI